MSEAKSQAKEKSTPATTIVASTFNPIKLLVEELKLSEPSIAATIGLLGEGATVPFIARYRKEVTGGLDEVQIRTIQERHAYMLELEERRQTILASINEQGKLTDELKAKIEAVTTKAVLEDLYLPFKPKRRTRATIAKERGLEPLALRILAQPLEGNPTAEAAAFINAEKEVPDTEVALAGARDIVAEIISENAEIRAALRDIYAKEGTLISEANPEKTKEPTKFEMYYDHRESAATIPSHRFLAIKRGCNEEVLRMRLEVPSERVLPLILEKSGHHLRSPFAEELRQAAEDSFHRLLDQSVATDVRIDLKMRSDNAAVDVFASNLSNVLLAAPLGGQAVIGIDPGLRTGCKCVAIDATGKYLEYVMINICQGDEALARSAQILTAFALKHQPMAIAIGNGTASRETEAFVRQTLKAANLTQIVVVVVNESGASVYSASDVARDEFPELDVSIRGAISIARRLQDPLAELVKIDPKSIGVGQYQHDVHQPLLVRKLDEVVESCVNQVGVDLNTASAPLLARVAGLGPSMAKKIVAHREKNGAFNNRQGLLKVSGLGPRTFEQCAGFLRLHGSDNPLDGSAVHPERYALVDRIATDMNVLVSELVGNQELAARIEIKRYVNNEVGEPTLRDIVEELKKPGRDPRAEFEPPQFRDDAHTIEDLKPGMEFEGVVTNVTAFGAFVDIGVHQDGLVHISQLADRFVQDPQEVVRAGQKLKVRVLEIDVVRKRIALTARSGEGQVAGANGNGGRDQRERDNRREKSASGVNYGAGQKNRGPNAGPQPARDNQKFSNNPFAAFFKNR